MSATATKPDQELVVNAPPETAFWKRYNDRLEVPISFTASLALHVGLVCGLFFVLLQFMKGPEKPFIPITLLEGEDLAGQGRPGFTPGTSDVPAKAFQTPSISDVARLTDPTKLPDIKNEMIEQFRVDSDIAINVPDADAAIFGSLDAELRKKLWGPGKPKGEGPGVGNGGTGADSTRARSMRWVMRFSVQSGDDYVRQLARLNATLLFPVPPANKEMFIINNLSHRETPRPATSAEIDQLSRQMRFCDITATAVREVGIALRLPFVPQSFFAFFPKDLEAKLAKDEESYRGRKAKDIEETIFEVNVRGAEVEFRIVGQTVRK